MNRLHQLRHAKTKCKGRRGRNVPQPSRGIELFAAFALNQILVFDDLHGFLDELQSYSRELDEMGEPTEKIEAKETFHLLDAVQ